MTAAAAGEPRGWVVVGAHHPVLVGLSLAAIYAGAKVLAPSGILPLIVDTDGARLGEWPSPWGAIVSTAALVAYALWAVALVGHLKVMCPRCMEDAPADPQAAVEKHRRALRALHAIADQPRYVVVGSVGVAIVLLSVLPPVLAGIGFGLAMAVLSVLSAIHLPLQPWCPQCRWGDGGDEETAPDPAPVPSGVNDRTTT